MVRRLTCDSSQPSSQSGIIGQNKGRMELKFFNKLFYRSCKPQNFSSWAEKWETVYIQHSSICTVCPGQFRGACTIEAAHVSAIGPLEGEGPTYLLEGGGRLGIVIKQGGKELSQASWKRGWTDKKTLGHSVQGGIWMGPSWYCYWGSLRFMDATGLIPCCELYLVYHHIICCCYGNIFSNPGNSWVKLFRPLSHWQKIREISTSFTLNTGPTFL